MTWARLASARVPHAFRLALAGRATSDCGGLRCSRSAMSTNGRESRFVALIY